MQHPTGGLALQKRIGFVKQIKMKILRHRSAICSLLLLILLNSCSGQDKKDDFIGKYHIDKTIPVDTTAITLLKIKQTSNWTISLQEKDNFELSGNEKNIVGYWNIERVNDSEYKILLQGGGWTIKGRFDGKTMYFNYPYKMFDSLFSEVTFTKDGK
jgi:hypothetical protein